MGIAEVVMEALRTMREHRLRTGLTVLGTVTGVAFLIAMITVIEGMGRYIENDLVGKVYGFNTVKVRQRPVVADEDEQAVRRYARNPELTFDDADWLQARMRAPGALAASSSKQARVATPAGGVVEGVRVIAASPSYFGVQGLRVERGRPFSDREADRGMAVAVLGRDVAARLFPGRAPLGQTVQVAGVPVRVVGVLEKQGSLFSLSLDKMLLVPARSPLNGVLFRRNVVEAISFRAREPAGVPAAAVELEGWMRLRHGQRPLDANDFEISTSQGAMEVWGRVSRVMMVAGPALVGIALLVSALVNANVMLVAVSERTREIGIRMAMGARRKDILLQFITEAVTISGVGGAAGVLAGVVFTVLIAVLSPLPARVAPWSLVVGVAVGAAVGVAAGVYPAWRASRLDPIEALGHE
ncbi:MAG TPA: ABC transporter permease [Longimicrobium sp.]|nr:ABC transporter permease [Longimicrobium sp.]